MSVTWPITGRLVVEYIVEVLPDDPAYRFTTPQWVIIGYHDTRESARQFAENLDAPPHYRTRVRQHLSQEPR